MTEELASAAETRAPLRHPRACGDPGKQPWNANLSPSLPWDIFSRNSPYGIANMAKDLARAAEIRGPPHHSREGGSPEKQVVSTPLLQRIGTAIAPTNRKTFSPLSLDTRLPGYDGVHSTYSGNPRPTALSRQRRCPCGHNGLMNWHSVPVDATTASQAKNALSVQSLNQVSVQIKPLQALLPSSNKGFAAATKTLSIFASQIDNELP